MERVEKEKERVERERVEKERERVEQIEAMKRFLGPHLFHFAQKIHQEGFHSPSMLASLNEQELNQVAQHFGFTLKEKFVFMKLFNQNQPSTNVTTTTTTHTGPLTVRWNNQEDTKNVKYVPVIQLVGKFKPKGSCRNYVSHLKDEIPYLDDIIDGVNNWFLSFVQDPDHNPYGLQEDEIIALGFYTFDLMVCEKEDNFYWIFNKVLIQRNPHKIQSWMGYIYYLQLALSKFPNSEVTVYRGISSDQLDNFIQNYTCGTRIHWSAYTSSSLNLSHAKKFAGPNGIIITISILNGKNISSYSVFGGESEILLSPNMTFIVIQAKFNEGYYLVDLQEIATDSLVIF
eukprot:TRINITY_DN3897_c0_g1_i14.p1 TRINITY_DN3897_c0_g1~~TRINITY_DN3897_c0_g1_i14.p1  ORF type:complete len:344 (+),score=93.71 TRINITY_DN3897_c0_g1_i14:433-1464(+)